MKSSVLSFTPEEAAQATEYSLRYSNGVSDNMRELWDYTVKEFFDSDKMSSELEGITCKFMAQLLKPKRVLEIGSYSGFATLAFYEGTVDTKAEIITTEIEPRMIECTKRTISRYGLSDRVTLLEGPAADSMQTLSGEFDLIFVDADKEGYENYVKIALDKKLLSKNGLMMIDNVFSRGLAIGTEVGKNYLNKDLIPYWIECGKKMQQLGEFCKNDPRIDNLVMPVYDGTAFIRWKTT